ncbi:hypothetical protein HK097_010928 [Rhizophlyctis rosea]|uniref:Uncharacterized protein n=1 Tax=Rhizophlyctis rosea TaxID=64517 RepID=A0AAD5S704_9FUNG|nr:hypothetical protein HK097_010928 [Rhizophlyctis rosea]
MKFLPILALVGSAAAFSEYYTSECVQPCQSSQDELQSCSKSTGVAYNAPDVSPIWKCAAPKLAADVQCQTCVGASKAKDAYTQTIWHASSGSGDVNADAKALAVAAENDRGQSTVDGNNNGNNNNNGTAPGGVPAGTPGNNNGTAETGTDHSSTNGTVIGDGPNAGQSPNSTSQNGQGSVVNGTRTVSTTSPTATATQAVAGSGAGSIRAGIVGLAGVLGAAVFML